MTAANAAGTSAVSNISNVATPLVAQPPNAPLIVSVLPRNNSLIVSWSAPTLLGGNPLKGYVLTVSGVAKPVKAKATALQTTVKKLTNGTPYSLSLVATSKAGSSPAATATGTPQATYAPSAPASLQVAPDGNGNLMTAGARSPDIRSVDNEKPLTATAASRPPEAPWLPPLPARQPPPR